MNTVTLRRVARSVKSQSRSYNVAGRQAAARRRRQAILTAGARLFLERGYVATTMAEIAAEAGVALDTVYAVVGRKPSLFRLLIEMAISGTDEPVPAEARDYVLAIHAEADAAGKLQLYASAMASIHARLAPLIRVLSAAAAADPELSAMWTEIAKRRARNMRLLVRELETTGSLREDLSVDEAADVIWAMNAPEFYLLLVDERGWDSEHYARWLADAWRRLLLK